MFSRHRAPLARTMATLVLSFGGTLNALAAPIALTPAAPPLANIGDTITFDLRVTGVTDLYAFNFSLAFDPTVVNLSGLTEGPALGTAGTTFFVAGAFDNVSGLLDLSGDTLIGAISGFSGDGVLATITFNAVGGGVSAISLNDVLLLDSAFAMIDSTSSSATVQVAGGVTVPEPATYALVMSALAAMSLARRKPASVG